MTEENKIYEGIAIVGMAGRVPGAKTMDRFWENLCDGVESITFFSDEELLSRGAPLEWFENPNYVKASPVLEEIDRFDASFFDFTPKEARTLDPQIRFFLEGAWEAMEHAGYDVSRYEGSVGVYCGVGMNRYYQNNLLRNEEFLNATNFNHLFYSSDKDFLSTRVSYLFGLRGPSMSVQTACSSSLVATHLACESILNRECDMALAGGVSITVPHGLGYIYEPGSYASPDGHCRAFDENSQGIIFGSGMGVVVLKHVEDAIENGDTIWAVIKGSAINNDGSVKMGYTAPGVDGQVDVISKALLMANINPETIGYVEAHGTGTNLGDPVEIEALTEAYRDFTDKKQYCAIGSVKTNIGHLDTAAGVVGLIKTAMTLKHGKIPASLGYEKPNPKIDFANSPFQVNNRLKEWERQDFPRRAAVSSFGIGGTNAHIVLEEPPTIKEKPSNPCHTVLIPLSAKTENSLKEASQALANYLEAEPNANLADVAYTHQVARKEFHRRKAIVAQNREEAIQLLRSESEERTTTLTPTCDEPEVTFLFSGQGSQFLNMGKELYRQETGFRKTVDRCFDFLQPHMDRNLHELLFPENESDELQQVLARTEYTQPILFTIEYAIAKLLIDKGIQPKSMIGHSLGEYVAAAISGVFSLEDALTVVLTRGQLMSSQKTGTMMAVSLSAKELEPLLGDQLVLATYNAPDQCVVAGPFEAVDQLEATLKPKEGVLTSRLRISLASHSPLMDPILDDFRACVAKVKLNPPKIPFISNVTGSWITTEEATDPAYWSRHIRSAVRFSQGVDTLLRPGQNNRDKRFLLVESGPGKALTTLIEQQLPESVSVKTVRTMRHRKESFSDTLFFYQALGTFWMEGVSMDWSKLKEKNAVRKRLILPTYSFDRQSYWVEASEPFVPGISKMRSSSQSDTRGAEKDGFENWYHIPIWKHAGFRTKGEPVSAAQSTWLLFADQAGAGIKLREALIENGLNVIAVSHGKSFIQKTENEFQLNPTKTEDYRTLLTILKDKKELPTNLLHCWNFTNNIAEQGSLSFDHFQQVGFESLIAFMQAWKRVANTAPLRIGVISNGLQKVTGKELINPAKSTLLGPVRAIPYEYPGVSCKSIDLDFGTANSDEATEKRMLQNLLREMNQPEEEDVVAWRGTQRWTQRFTPTKALPTSKESALFHEGGVYLVTGGLGAIALTLVESVLDTTPAKFALMGRSTFPAKEQWETWLREHPESDKTSQKIQKLIELERMGAEIMILSANINNREATEQAVQTVREQWGSIHGVIHTAGLPGEHMIQFNDQKSFAEVLAPKTTGVYVLESIFQGKGLEFMIFCSSVTAYLGGVAQAAYSGANAFLDSYAQNARKDPKWEGTNFLSINWPGWSEIGMAVEAAAAAKSLQTESVFKPLKQLNHPLLDNLLIDTPERKLFSSTFNVEKDWVLHEHRISGRALIAGVTYIELVRAAWFHGEDGGDLEIEELFFQTPLVLDEKENRTVYTLLIQDERGYQFHVISKLETEWEGDTKWLEHATGKLTPVETVSNHYAIDEISERCPTRIEASEKTSSEEQENGLVALGPRWQCTKRVHLGEHEALILLELQKDYQGDTEQFRLHPALMDVATSIASSYMTNEDFLPFHYKRITVRQTIPARIYSYVQLHEENSSKDTITFDLKILDENGEQLLDIEGFTKKKISQRESISVDEQKKQLSIPGVAQQKNDFYANLFQELHNGKQFNDFNTITPTEGAKSFQRMVAQRAYGQILLSPQNFADVQREFRELDKKKLQSDHQSGVSKGEFHPRPELPNKYIATETKIEKRIEQVWKELLEFEKIGLDDNFFDLGGDSLMAISLSNKMTQDLAVEISVMDLFDQPTIRELAKLPLFEAAKTTETPVSKTITAETKSTVVAETKPKAKLSGRDPKANLSDGDPDRKVAIIGMACRFPGAGDPEQFWSNLIDEKDTLSDLHMDLSEVETPNFQLIKKAQILESIDRFDASFFGFSDKEALVMSPQHRFFLENSWEALEQAGYDPTAYDGKIAVFAGPGNNHYLNNLTDDKELIKNMDPRQLEDGNDPAFVGAAVSYKLNLKGPTMTVQAGCATSLVAIHQARFSLVRGECDMALAGAVSIRIPQEYPYPYVEGGIYSPDGYVRTFDANARGTIFSSGSAVVVLKRLDRAIQDRDTIYAVVRGSAVNSSGYQKSGFNVPSGSAERDVILEAMADAQVTADRIQYVEAHGTGTMVGDVIEVDALTQAFRNSTDKKRYCALGAVKSNIGHADTASGMAGVIKTALAMKREELPATANFQTENPAIDFENSPFYVNSKRSSWKKGELTGMAGISSFSMGGMNAHLILEEAPEVVSEAHTKEWQLLLLSAKTETALETMSHNLAQFLETEREVNLSDLAYTLQVGRKRFEYRKAILCKNRQEAIDNLRSSNRKNGETLYFHPELETVWEKPENVLCYDRFQTAIGSELKACFQLLAKQWLTGTTIDWNRLYQEEKRLRIPLPTYPFERKSYWVGPGAGDDTTITKTFAMDQSKQRPEPATINKKAEIPQLIQSANKEPRPNLEVSYTEPETALEKQLAKIWEDLFALEKVGVHDDFFSLGGHSMQALSMINTGKQAGLRFSINDLYDHSTIAELVKVVKEEAGENRKAESIYGEYPLLPNRVWLLNRRAEDRPESDLEHWTFSRLWEFPLDLSPSMIREALEIVLMHHEGLRMRLLKTDRGIREYIPPTIEEDIFSTIDLRLFPKEEQFQLIEQVSISLQQSVSMFGTGTRFVLFDPGNGRSHYFLTYFHHVLIDDYSYRIFMEDLVTVLYQMKSGNPVELPIKSASIKEYSERLYEYAQSEKGKKELDFIVSQPWDKYIPITVDYPENMGGNTFGNGDDVEIIFNNEQSDQVRRVLDQRNGYTKLLEMTIVAMVKTFETWTGSSTLVIDTQFHERDPHFADLDISRTIAGVTDSIAIPFDLEGATTPEEMLDRVHKQLHDARTKGKAYSALLYLSEDEAVRKTMKALPRPDVSINLIPNEREYEIMPMEEYTRFEWKHWCSEHLLKNHLVDFRTLFNEEGNLKTLLEFSKPIYDRSRIEALGEIYREQFLKLL